MKSSRLLQRYGIWADWDNPYLTLNPEYEAAQVKNCVGHHLQYIIFDRFCVPD